MEDLRQVFVIKATKDISPDDKIKVAVYCRVSTDSDDQLNSFIEQVRYYTDFINQNPNMKLVDIYADEGVTGTSIAKRDEFNRMMLDAKKGKIDKIYVKSVSRFARNSKECLENIRLLKSYGISVFFENDGIDTKILNHEIILYRNIKNLMLQPDASFMPVKKLLFDFVKEEFDAMQSEFSLGITSELTRYICETEISQDCLNVEFMKNTVSKIIVLSDGNINVRFINGKEISNTSEELK